MAADRQTRAVYVISVAAELAGVHPQTLRIYERKGLVDPARTGGGSRRYSERDIERLRRIQDLTNAGLNLEGVRRVIELEDEVNRLRQELVIAAEDTAQAIERVHRHYRRDLVPVRNSPVPWRSGL
jgi:MerR family transcriptional regulator, heat shock protein HspR